MERSDIPVLPRGVRLHFDKVRDNWVLLAPERAVTLDQIGHAILSMVDGQSSFGQIIDGLAARYEAPVELIQKDSGNLLDALRARRFMELAP